jgi:thioredoxin-like negative regulator of GroEL
MTTEADIAFRQAFAMCPSNAEVAMRYANFLIAAGRTRDALSVVSISCQLYPDHPAMHDLLEHLRVLNAPSR